MTNKTKVQFECGCEYTRGDADANFHKWWICKKHSTRLYKLIEDDVA